VRRCRLPESLAIFVMRGTVVEQSLVVTGRLIGFVTPPGGPLVARDVRKDGVLVRLRHTGDYITARFA